MMTFLILAGTAVVGSTDDTNQALGLLAEASAACPGNVSLAEVLIPAADPRTAIPGELDRAIDAWNLMTKRLMGVKARIDKVENRERLVKPYRKWKCEIGQRAYMLEQLMPDIEAQPFIWRTITFGWLFRAKSGEFNSDKLHARKYLRGNGNGQATERDYLQVAARVAAYNKFHVDGESFEHGVGVTWDRWEALRKQFDGGAGL